MEYVLEMRKRIDSTISLYSSAVKLSLNRNYETDDLNNSIEVFGKSCQEVYFYYMENKTLFSSVDNEFMEIMKLYNNLRNQKDKELINALENIYKKLVSVRDKCIKLKV